MKITLLFYVSVSGHFGAFRPDNVKMPYIWCRAFETRESAQHFANTQTIGDYYFEEVEVFK